MSRYMKALLPKSTIYITKILMLVMVLALDVNTWAQEKSLPTMAELQAQGEVSTITLKDGRKYTYQQLSKMTDDEKENIRDQVENRGERIKFRKWEMDVSKAYMAEKEKQKAEKEKQSAELDKQNAEKEKQSAELDKQIAAYKVIDKYQKQLLAGKREFSATEKVELKNAITTDGIPSKLAASLMPWIK
jgi:cell division protein FtsB